MFAEGGAEKLIDRMNQYTHCSESHKAQRHWLLLLNVCVRDREKTLVYTQSGLHLNLICHI